MSNNQYDIISEAENVGFKVSTVYQAHLRQWQEKTKTSAWDRYIHGMRMESWGGFTNVKVHHFCRYIDPSSMLPVTYYVYECDGSNGLAEGIFKDEPGEEWLWKRK